jgi:hypothetical protein
MGTKHYIIVGLLIVGFLFVYHVAVQQRAGLKGVLSGVGIGK